MPRLNIERQNKLEPERIEQVKHTLSARGCLILGSEDKKSVSFVYKGNVCTIWPYSGYFNGKGLTAGRGIDNLLKQIK
jgi:hypothetical protein